MLLYQNYDLSAANTLALPAKAQRAVIFDDVNQLPALQLLLKNHAHKKRRVLGGGSNVVMADYLDAIVIKVANKGIQGVSQDGNTVMVEAQAGESWHTFVQHCIAQEWYGLENLALIPGTVGAAPVQNIGAYGVELQQFVHQVHVWDFTRGELVTFTANECQFAYRDSFFKRSLPGRYLIIAVRFILHTQRKWQPIVSYPDLENAPSLQNTEHITPQQVFDAVVAIRQNKLPDPQQLPNAGSFFKNPIITKADYELLLQRYPALVAYEHGTKHYKLAAGWLIDQAGWKGKRLGPVGMHERQALVLVNYARATAADVQALVEQIKADVQQQFGVVLEQEPVAFS